MSGKSFGEKVRQAPLTTGESGTSSSDATEPARKPRTHVVAKGDTLSAIAEQHYGNAKKYMKIFEANRELLTDPDKMQPGQQLTIPD